MQAAAVGDEKSLLLLLCSGADATLADANGYTAYDIAAMNSEHVCLGLLITDGAPHGVDLMQTFSIAVRREDDDAALICAVLCAGQLQHEATTTAEHDLEKRLAIEAVEYILKVRLNRPDLVDQEVWMQMGFENERAADLSMWGELYQPI